MKLAFSTLGCPLYSIDEIIAMAEKNQYEGVGIRTVRGKSMLTDLEEFSPKGIAETAKKFKKAGLAVSCVMSGVRFTSPEAEERKTQLKIAEAYIEIAVSLESSYVRIFGGPIKPEMNEKETLDRIIEGFRKAGDLAQRQGVLLLLETHDSFATGKKTRALLDAVKHPGIAVVWDILHTIRSGETLKETWDAVGDWVKDVHIKDSSKFSPESFDLKLPGKGILPIPEAVKLLREKGWDEWLTFEWEKGWHPEIEEPEVAIPFYAHYMRTLLKEIHNESERGS